MSFAQYVKSVGHAKRYYGGQTKSHKCQFGGTTDRTKILISNLKGGKMFLTYTGSRKA